MNREEYEISRGISVGKGWQDNYNPNDITTEEYRRVLKFQSGCAICHKFITGTDCNVDHMHWGKRFIRGMLCTSCNIKLGEVEHMRREATNNEIIYMLNPPFYQLGIYRSYTGRES